MADDTSDTRGTNGGSQHASGRRRRTAPRRRLLRIAVWAVAGLVVVGGAGAGYLYFKLNGNIKGVNINQALGDNRPEQVDNGSEDILVLGSDSRAGANDKYGTDEGSARSDTAMIVHLYEGHKTASVVSIPRDTLITRPECARTGGGTSPAVNKVMFNESYSVGGPACAVKTVESMTGIRMDHYIEVDFTGFKGLIDALGGVPVTTSKAIHDTSSHLDLAAGTHTLNGEQSLGLVRTRHAVADGSDLGRIQLQQAFMKALMDRVNGLGLLSSPTRLYKVADKATKAITTDSDLASISGLKSLAGSLKGLKSENINMVTLPVQYAKSDANRVEPMDSQAALVWQTLKADLPIPAAATKGSAADETDAKGVVGTGS
ncbi:LytR family transcriptional regulator [Streptomyces sp. So13.3]|uniref:LCP family protein n=1 Tax=unclassified Streptomyces TaxID=2593676 RepID=UPI001106C33F|nr:MULTISPECIES: LCP family protein [unclassified Streptomyces]MCZ4096539.1 LCP family protein [Streptomyces sp. H39-C1]QNA75331.1 LytR family transcriptional regulator [Streptomyces sp. So13.3]